MDRLEIAAGWSAARLAAVRNQMIEMDVAGLVIPRWNRHQSEYCSLHEELLAWSTGFSGTWGIGFVTLTEAALFVDGRYTVQAQSEVSADFAQHHLYNDKYEKWLGHALRSGERLGFDPLVATPEMLARLQSASAEFGFELVALEDFPVALAWEDRPPPPFSPAIPFPESRCGESSDSKRRRLAQHLREAGTDLLIESQLDNVAWLLNWRGADVPDNPFIDAFVIADKSGHVEAFVDRRKLGNQLDPFELDGVDLHPIDSFSDILNERITPSLAVTSDLRFSPALVKILCDRNDAQFVAATSPITRLKSIKNAVELAGMRAAALRDSVAWIELLSWLDRVVPACEKDGRPLSELEVETAFDEIRRQFPEWVSNSFRTISASGRNAAMCHYNAPMSGGSSLSSQELFLLDSGAQYLDGTTDTTRTVCFGEPDAEWRKCYTLVLKGHIRLSSLRFPPGTRGYQIDAFAREALWQHGLDYDHGTGHGVGHFLSVHEHPQRLSKDPLDEPLLAGMTITNEPGYYRAGEFGIRIENLCEIGAANDGFLHLQPIAFVPLDRKLIETAMLTGNEIAWVDAYHQEIRSKLATSLRSEAAADWLERATHPLI